MPEPNPPPKHLVILMHGIGTRAIWMDEVGNALEQAGFKVEHTYYGRYPIWRFVLHSKDAEEQAIKRLKDDIASAINIKPKPDLVSVIAHSFGTHAFAKILSEPKQADPDPDQGGDAGAADQEPSLPAKWHRIIFCGSVLRDDYPFKEVLARFDGPLLNEVGCEDLWPRIAEKIGYGGVGAYGFNRPGVRTRWHREFRHSDFLNEQFCRDNWVPFLRDGTISPGDKAFIRPWLRMPKWPGRAWEKFWSFRYKMAAILGFVLLVVVFAVATVFNLGLTTMSQRSLCVREINSAFDLPTRAAVKDFLIARELAKEDFVFPEDEQLLLWAISFSPKSVLALLDAARGLADAIGVDDCKKSQFKNAFEVGSFARFPKSNTTHLVEQFQRSLNATLSDKLAPVAVTGQLDQSTREAIRFFRQQNGLPSSDEVDLSFMKKFGSTGSPPATPAGQTR